MTTAYLDGVPVPHTVIDPKVHRFIGMFRPAVAPDSRYTDEEGKVHYAAILLCGCNQLLECRETAHLHWMQGHFDIPQYVSLGTHMTHSNYADFIDLLARIETREWRKGYWTAYATVDGIDMSGAGASEKEAISHLLEAIEERGSL